MDEIHWRSRLGWLLERVGETARRGLPPQALHPPGWRWELEWWLMACIGRLGSDAGAYRAVVNRELGRGQPLPELRFEELSVGDILDHGLGRSVLSDEQLVRLAFTPDAVNKLTEELAAVGPEVSDIWAAVRYARDLPLVEPEVVMRESTPEETAEAVERIKNRARLEEEVLGEELEFLKMRQEVMGLLQDRLRQPEENSSDELFDEDESLDDIDPL